MPPARRSRKRPGFGGSCPASFKKLVWHDGYDAGMGLPQKSHAGLKKPAGCSPAFLKKVWHDGFEAGEKDKLGSAAPQAAAAAEAAVEEVFNDAVIVGAEAREETDLDKRWKAVEKESAIAKEAMSWASSLALSAGVHPDLIRSMRDLGITIGLALKG